MHTESRIEIPWLKNMSYIRLRFFYQCTMPGTTDDYLVTKLRRSIGPILKKYKGYKGCNANGDEYCREECNKSKDCVYYWAHANMNVHVRAFYLKILPSFRHRRIEFLKNEELHFDLVFLGHAHRWIKACVIPMMAVPLQFKDNNIAFECAEVRYVDREGRTGPIAQMNDDDFSKARIFFADVPERPIKTSQIEITFHTPSEISMPRQAGKKVFLKDAKDLTFKNLIMTMLTRTQMVAMEHFGFKPVDDTGEVVNRLIVKAADVQMKKLDGARHEKIVIKNRKLGGIMGGFKIRGELPPFLELIEACAVLGVGKNIMDGFGHYTWQILD